jgi:predicted Fe-S protein YdhL (DUF1289 family)
MIQNQKPLLATSPCINVCTLDAINGLCHGCFRTIDEISIWSRASIDEKLAILSAVSRRREALS